MKHKKVFKKIIAVLLALMTVMSIATPAMAALHYLIHSTENNEQ